MNIDGMQIWIFTDIFQFFWGDLPPDPLCLDLRQFEWQNPMISMIVAAGTESDWQRQTSVTP